MIPIKSPDTDPLALELTKYLPISTIPSIGGLLTAPHFQANAVRLEMLVHLAVAHCNSKKKAGYKELERWLNDYLGQTNLTLLEDPVEDVFITNVETPEGNRRIFEGIWESSDYFLQVTLETLSSFEGWQETQVLLKSAFALLRLSDCVAERLSLNRWHIEQSQDKGYITIVPATRIKERARAITFTKTDLKNLRVKYDDLMPFIFHLDDRSKLLTELIGNSSLERRPLLDIGEALVLVLPHAVSPAIRRFVLSELKQTGHLRVFSKALETIQARQLEKDGFREIKDQTISLRPPKADDEPSISLHCWLLRYDINKYIHLILLHDRLDLMEENGINSFMEYPELKRVSLEKYLNKVAKYCQTMSDYSEGMTIIVMGGLGRGFLLGFNELPNSWRFSAIRLSDLLMISEGTNHTLKRYFKCIKQKDWAEHEGVNFNNINGDFNFFCFWHEANYQLIPRDFLVGNNTMLMIMPDFVLPFRQQLRNLVDRHVVKTASGQFVQVMRLGRDTYFKSMQDRPIYASLNHLQAGILGGVVETSRGPSWLIIELYNNTENVRHLLYDMWDGFIALYDRIVSEIETLFSNLLLNPIEIRLDFCEFTVPKDIEDMVSHQHVDEPELIVNHTQNTVHIKFPSNFLILFKQPENIGEKYVLKAITQGLLNLHQGSEGNIDANMLETLLNNVVGDEGIRIFHIFHTYLPIEHLISQIEQEPTFIAHEDFVFAKLRLSEGCIPITSDAVLKSKDECNDYLHKVVDKVWNQLRTLLKQFNRTSVICQTLAVHEAIIKDRDHWRRTAKAVKALYYPTDDVYSVAQEREMNRIHIALPARTIMEMALCECPISGGRELSQWELDELLAKAALMIEVAIDSDAINGELIRPEVYLHANGEYTVDRSFLESMVHPFIKNYSYEEFERASGEYRKLYHQESPGVSIRAEDVFSDNFIKSFTAEFGLSPDEAKHGLGELIEYAVEFKNVVIETTFESLRKRLIKNRDLSPKSCQAFFKMFGLYHRQEWNKPPNGFKTKDIYPWRFRRRLSLVVKPLLVFGIHYSDKVIYGAGSIYYSGFLIIQRTESGHYPSEFFTSVEMKKYIGSVNDERGHAFTRLVAEKLRKNGWKAREEVNMTELGATSKLGDIDVLSWKSSGEVLLIECKRLQLARTVAEIAEICRRFRGEAKDELDKHIKRINWISQHKENLKKVIGFIPNSNCIDARLVTNTHVPMMYIDSLPIKKEKILSYNRLVDLL